MRYTLFLSSCATILIAASSIAQGAPGRVVESLNEGWSFSKNRAKTAKDAEALTYESVTIPHTWNAEDLPSGKDYYEGEAWYRRSLSAPADWKDKHIYLRFDGVGQVADVFVNGILVGEHKGGYSAFCYEITPALRFGADNEIQVRADNTIRPDVIPINNHLFGVFGGITRPVSLIVTGATRITPTDFGSSGVYLSTPSVTARNASVRVVAKVENGSPDARDLTVRAEILDVAGKVVAEGSATRHVFSEVVTPVEETVTLPHPRLWQARRDPYLYRVRVTVLHGTTEEDRVEQSLGVRTYSVDSKKGFILNGKPYRLYGVCRHQDWEGVGSAVTDDQTKTDMDLIKEMGATAIRFGHYQQDDTVYRLADEMGLVVWAEIPFVNAASGQEADNAKQQLTELIRQNYNHPSICFWGLHNEVYGKRESDYPIRLTRELHDIAKTEDPTRLDVSTSGTGDFKQPMHYHADLQAINRYYGWYYGKIDDLETWLNDAKKTRPGTRFAISEYGAEANVSQQAETLIEKFDAEKGQFFPENYQTMYHEKTWVILRRHPELFGTYVWNMFDFSVPGWSRGGANARNMKGLVTYDRKIRKDAFYWYKANWSSEPVLHLNESRVTERTIPDVAVTVYSNLGEPSLTLDGEPLAKPVAGADEVAYGWKVHLHPGRNVVRTTVTKGGRTYADEVVWNLKS